MVSCTGSNQPRISELGRPQSGRTTLFRPYHPWLGWLLIVAVGTAILLMPAFVSRQPFLFADTTAYVRGADAVVITLTDSRSEWSG